MKATNRLVAIAGMLIASSGCYHAVIETGLTPSTQTIEKPWASGWVYGLVAPNPVSTMQRCPGGVARVETQHSFVNMLVQGITFGIYTPMTIKVTCAAGPARSAGPDMRTIDIGAAPSAADQAAALQYASSIATVWQQTVFVRQQ